IKETVGESRGWFGKKKAEMDYRFETTGKPLSELDEFERDLVEFMMEQAGDQKSFTMAGLKKAASKKRSKFQKWFRQWVKTVGERCKSYEFFEPYPIRAMVLNVVCGLVVTTLGVYMSVKSETAAGIPAIILGAVQAIFTVFLNRHTIEGRRLYVGWRDFKKHIKSLGRALGPVTLDSRAWSTYLAAAIIFGMHKKLIPKLQIADGSGNAVYPVWFYAAHGGGLDQSFSSLADGFSTMIDSVTTTVSSASGVGGGASAGGGGGSGGGGGGAG
ncbi:MAG: DUF2207 domain-containing protein, partial [Candidatus Latescibacterota bacterium]